MAGLSLKVGGFGGVGTTDNQNYGTQKSFNTVTSAAFGPGSTVETPSRGSILMPNDGFGISVSAGVVALALLIIYYRALPGK
jgi:hypothetical protein